MADVTVHMKCVCVCISWIQCGTLPRVRLFKGCRSHFKRDRDPRCVRKMSRATREEVSIIIR